MGDYVVTGFAKSTNSRCLVYVLGNTTKEEAEQRFNNFINNPDDNAKKLQNEITDFEIEYVEPKECWWRNC